jgi:DNA-binding LytR/AlgR family response regulator
LRVLVVDDEAAARRRLAGLLAELDEEVVAEAADGLEALRLVPQLRPDLLLLDIAMPEVDGFDVAAHLPEPRPLIVFQTAYDEYALQAFEHEALDYVVKPVSRERLERALERARLRLAERRRQELSGELLDQLRRAVGSAAVPGRRSRLLVRDRAGHRLLHWREVSRFCAEQGLVYAVTAEGRHLVEASLQQLEERAAGAFIRANRSELVHLDHVARIVRSGDGSALLTLDDGTRVRVSRRRVPEVRRALEQP